MKGDFSKNPRCTYEYYLGQRLVAVRMDNWKLVFPHSLNSNTGSIPGHNGWPGKMNRTAFEGGLFDLRRDPGERYNMKDLYPEIVNKLAGTQNL